VDPPTLDYFMGRYRGASAGGDAGAVGGRLMWSLAPLAPASGWLSRAYVGAYVVHAPDEEDRTEAWRYGAQADLRLSRHPVVGRVEPLLSLGVGASRFDEEVRAPAPLRGDYGDWRWGDRTRTLLSVTPGVAVRVLLAPGFGIRGDARQVLDFDERVHRNLEFSGGLSLGV
jgi:hypothetical protein